MKTKYLAAIIGAVSFIGGYAVTVILTGSIGNPSVAVPTPTPTTIIGPTPLTTPFVVSEPYGAIGVAIALAVSLAVVGVIARRKK
jgi:hypothetical protein